MGVNALTRLARLGDDDSELLDKVRSLLKPREYTRLDDLIEVVIVSSEAGEAAAGMINISDSEDTSEPANRASAESPLNRRRTKIVAALSRKFGCELERSGGSLFRDFRGSIRVRVSVSKSHDAARHGHKYWYSITPRQIESASGASTSSFI